MATIKLRHICPSLLPVRVEQLGCSWTDLNESSYFMTFSKTCQNSRFIKIRT